jgi:hypothetical protein
MQTRHFSVGLFVLILLMLGSDVSAQGGWRQWNIFLRDGSKIVASPLAVNEKGHITYSMGNAPVERSKISYIAASAGDLPPAPDGKYDKDLVVKTDGTRSFGSVTFGNVKFSEGKILQNKKEIDLKDVAYIKFGKPKRSGR